LICLTPPQLLLAGPIPHSFDVTRHPTNPNTTVYGRNTSRDTSMTFQLHSQSLPSGSYGDTARCSSGMPWTHSRKCSWSRESTLYEQ
jgi:hypothetical protein